MTPLAEKAFREPLDNDRTDWVRQLMAGAQYFECSALDPIVQVRSNMSGEWNCTDELLQSQLPASHTWIEFKSYAIALSDDTRGNGNGVAFVGALMQFLESEPMRLVRFSIDENSSIITFPTPGVSKEILDRQAELAVNTAWYCIEAMQTQGGLCHAVEHNPTRQQRREAARKEKPCHKWVEIKLGRERKSGGGGSDNSTGRTVAWHYRRGHRIDHPNPNFPKWRKGCWVGDTDAGIRTHNYTVEVPA